MGSFNNYVDRILAFFDHPPTSPRQFIYWGLFTFVDIWPTNHLPYPFKVVFNDPFVNLGTDMEQCKILSYQKKAPVASDGHSNGLKVLYRYEKLLVQNFTTRWRSLWTQNCFVFLAQGWCSWNCLIVKKTSELKSAKLLLVFSQNM